ncbi:MAG: ribonuclease E/G [Geminicoccales bacterium]
MSKELFLELTPFGARAAILRHGELLEVRFADNEISDIRGQVFQGRVRSIDKDLDAAFVDCGHGQIAFLAGRDGRYASGQRRDEPLAQQLTEGQSLLVQGSGVSRDGKKPKVTTDIQITGIFSVFRPKRRSVKLSSKLSETGQSDRLLGLAKELFPDGGVIFRGAAGEASDDDLRTESERLRGVWAAIEAKADTAKAPANLFERKDPMHRVLHDAAQPDIARIVASDQVALVRARSYLESWLPLMASRLECVPGAFDINGINEQLDQALEPKVDLAGGGNIIIEQTAALTAIDVNSGGRRALDANLDAAKEIARQLRLQRIGGTIVVDFIDLESRSDREALMSGLKTAFADDPASVQILPPTPLGLVQISRQRLGKGLRERLSRPCSTCQGGGTTINLKASTERLLGELGERAVSPIPVKIRLAVDLYSYLASEAAEPFQDYLNSRGLVPPTLEPDNTLSPAAYRILGA